jgi:hypothetical protein
VALTLTLTSIYNVCHSKLMLVFEKMPKAPSHICPPLRAQLCAPLFQRFEEVGVEIQDHLIKAIYQGHGPTGENLLALFIIIWLLVLIYDHSLNQTNNAILWNIQNEDSAWQNEKSAWKNEKSAWQNEKSAWQNEESAWQNKESVLAGQDQISCFR